MIEKVQTKEMIESKKPMTPVRYNSPNPPKPLSTVFTVQQENVDTNAIKNGKIIDQIIDSKSAIDQIDTRKPSISFKNLTLMQTRLKSEMNDSRVKIKTLEFDRQSNDQSEGDFLFCSLIFNFL